MIATADRVRGAVLRALARSPVSSWVTTRERRIGLRAALAIGFAFVLAATFPALALAVGPIVFGIPHVAASLRYLVLRRGISRPLVVAIVLGSIAIVSARVLSRFGMTTAGARTATVIEISAGTLLFAIAAIEAARRSGRALRGVLALGVLGAGLALAVRAPATVQLAFVHVHNLGVVAIWLLLFRRKSATRSRFGLAHAVGAALVIALALALSGATIPIARALGGLDGFGVDCRDVAAWLAPTAPLAFALPLVIAHAFTDSVHYSFWLGVVPEEELPGEGSFTFRMTERGLARDFGRIGLAVVLAAAGAIALVAVVHAEVARSAYFVVAGFHGYVEGALLVWIVVAGSAADRKELATDRERIASPHVTSA